MPDFVLVHGHAGLAATDSAWERSPVFRCSNPACGKVHDMDKARRRSSGGCLPFARNTTPPRRRRPAKLYDCAMNAATPTRPRPRTLNSLGQPPPTWPDAPDDDLHKKLAAAVAAGDKDAVFEVAARVVAAGATEHSRPVDGLLPVEEVARRLDTSVRSISRYLARPNGDFPRPTYVGGRRKWEPADIAAYKKLRRLKHP